MACDVYRPAAIDQLHVVGEQIHVDVFSDRGNSDPVAIAQAGIAHAKANTASDGGTDAVIQLTVEYEGTAL